MAEYWFKPKTHGYGASPSNWKGWAATLGFVVVTTLVTLPLMVWPAVTHSGPRLWHVALWCALLIALTVGFMRLCKAKTDGEWRWRWGKDDT